MSTPPLRTLTCPTCGAPISFADQSREATCRFCGSVIERSDEAPTAADETQALRIDMTGDHIRVDAPSGGARSAHKFVIKMGQGGPMVIDMGDLANARSAGQVFMGSSASTGAAGPIRADVFTGTLPSTTGRPAGRRGGGCGLFLGLVLAVGGIGIAALVATGAGAWLLGRFVPGGTNGDGPELQEIFGDAVDDVTSAFTNVSLYGANSIVLGNGEFAGALAVPGVEYGASGDQPTAVYVIDGETGKLAWKSEPVEDAEEAYRVALAADDQHVFAVIDDNLYAYRRADGSLDWRASLSDKLPFCDEPGCLAAVDGKVIALAADGVVQAFDPAGEGRELWRATLENTPRQVFVVGDQAAILDRDSDNNGLLRVFNAQSGEETEVRLSCAGGGSPQDLDDSPTIHIDAETGDPVIFFGTYQLCAARLDAVTLQPVWELDLGDTISRRSFGFGGGTLLDEGVYVGLTDTGLVLINTDAGELIATADFEDVELMPVFVRDGHVIIRAKTTRGTAKFELWSLAVTTGEREWSYVIGEAEPIDPPDASGSAAWDGDRRFSIATVGDDLAVTVFSVSDETGLTAEISRLNLASGTSNADNRLELIKPDFVTSYVLSVVDRSNGRIALAETSKIYWIDLENGALANAWP